MIVVGVNSDYGIGRGVAKLTGSAYRNFQNKVFPDGESYIRLDANVKGEDVLLVQGMESQPDKRFVEMLMAVDAAFEAGAANVYGLIPYLAYARQDRVFSDGEPVSARAVLRALYDSGMSKIAVIEPHKEQELSYFKGKSVCVNALESVAAKAVAETGSSMLIAPDSGSWGRVNSIAKRLGLKSDYIEKNRSRVDGSLSMVKGLKNAEGNALILDDMISTGGTVAQASREAIAAGASSVNVAAVHLLLVGNAKEKIKDAGVTKVFGSNTILDSECEIIDVSGEAAKAVSTFID
ncbi:ribose-phosphate diphosphokinase [Candidatus Marsarchaeota archaeon]|nr:ribose-phosphate diphosphokinase [Candidatus Marsarchaeota archaeon]